MRLGQCKLRYEGNSKVLNDGFSRLIEFPGTFRDSVVCSPLYLCSVCLHCNSARGAGNLSELRWKLDRNSWC